jgi:junctophilin
MWYNEDEEEEDLLFSPALMARRASESWINAPPIEVMVSVITLESAAFMFKPTNI